MALGLEALQAGLHLLGELVVPAEEAVVLLAPVGLLLVAADVDAAELVVLDVAALLEVREEVAVLLLAQQRGEPALRSLQLGGVLLWVWLVELAHFLLAV